MQYNRERIEMLKAKYPPGTRIELISMQDDYAVPPGTIGTVRHVDDAGTIHMAWKNGRTLGLIPGEDSFRIIGQREQDSLTPAQPAKKNEPAKNKKHNHKTR